APRARARNRAAGRLPWRGRRRDRQRLAEREAARALRGERWFLEARPATGAALLQACQQGLPRRGEGHGADRQRRANRAAALLRDAAEIPARGRWPRRASSSRATARA